jgi:hypothetical protein
MTRCVPVVFTALLLLSVVARAQEEPSAEPADIIARLGSEQPADVAWGAYLAGREKTVEARPLLVQALRPNPARAGKEWRLVDRAVLDALILLDAKVPADLLLAKLGTRFNRHLLILLAREPVKNRRTLLDLFDRWEDDSSNLWLGTVGLGNLLAQTRAPGFAARILPWIEMSLTLSVHDKGMIGIGGGAGGPFAGRGHRRYKVPEGFPPTVSYDFVPAGSGGQMLIADGAVPVYVLRREWAGQKVTTSYHIHHAARDVCALGWTAALAGVPPGALGLARRENLATNWAGPEPFVIWATRCRDRILTRYWEIVQILVRDLLLDEQDARSLVPKLTVSVLDRRSEKGEALPPLPASKVVAPTFLLPVDAVEVVAQLRSGDPARTAWGAYHAGRQGLKRVVPRLVEMLRPHPTRTGEAWDFTTHATLDALIRLEARVPGDLLAAHFRGRASVLALILLAREPDRNRAVILALFDRWANGGSHVSIDALAAGNLLAGVKAPGFSARILRRISMRLLLYIREPGAFGGRGDRRNLRAGSHDARITLPEGFPPFVQYRLETGPSSDGSRLVADGTRPVRYVRVERTGRHFIAGRSGMGIRTEHVTREWIASMLGCGPEDLGIPSKDSHSMDWTSEDAYLTWATGRRDRLVAMYWKVVRGLIARDALTVGEARALAPSLAVEVRDQREAPSALPPIPPTTVKSGLPPEGDDGDR